MRNAEDGIDRVVAVRSGCAGAAPVSVCRLVCGFSLVD